MTRKTAQPAVARLLRRPAYFTYDPAHGGLYYFAPADATPPPYLIQRSVEAILDIAADGTLAGVELVMGKLPKPPAMPQPKLVTNRTASNTDESK